MSLMLKLHWKIEALIWKREELTTTSILIESWRVRHGDAGEEKFDVLGLVPRYNTRLYVLQISLLARQRDHPVFSFRPEMLYRLLRRPASETMQMSEKMSQFIHYR